MGYVSHGRFNSNVSCVCLSDDTLSRNSQAQAAEDILDKYRNIKRTSPSEGATAAAYDATGQCLSRSATPTHTRTLNEFERVNVLYTELCGEECVHNSPRDEALQNMSTDDLPDSASQTAQQHDSRRFSFRSVNPYQLTEVTQL